MSDLDGNKKLAVQLKFQHPQKNTMAGGTLCEHYLYLKNKRKKPENDILSIICFIQ